MDHIKPKNISLSNRYYYAYTYDCYCFLGYVLPYGQMSLWGATVITNLISAIPWIGQDIVEFIWGGFSVNNATLNRFFALHFVLPFVLAALVLMHLIVLHDTAGSSNPLGSIR